MSVTVAWFVAMMLGSALLMLFVLTVRGGVRRAFGPGLAYCLWLLPVIRMLLPPIPATVTPSASPGALVVLAIGGEAPSVAPDGYSIFAAAGSIVMLVWAGGAALVFGIAIIRHLRVCHRLIARGRGLAIHGSVSIIETDVAGPIAFGVWHRYVAVPRDFTLRYNAGERALALAHELGHHARGDLLANWVALLVLALHWCNPVAWAAFRAFRNDQEVANDARVVGQRGAGIRRLYARMLAKTSAIDVFSTCGLHSFSNLKGRLVMLTRHPVSKVRLMIGGTALAVFGGAALAATASGTNAAPGDGQARTIIVRPVGGGNFTLVVKGVELRPGAALPAGLRLPADFAGSNGCDLGAAAGSTAMVIKGSGPDVSYSVVCAGAGTADLRATLLQSVASLKKLRGMVATQRTTPSFPDADQRDALGAIDHSLGEVEAVLARGA